MLGTKVLDRDEIQAIVRRLASDIETDLAGRSPIFIGVLKGCVYFLTDLTRHLREAGTRGGSCRERLANMARAYAEMILEYQDTAQLMLRDLAQFDWEEIMQMLPGLQLQTPSAIAAVVE